MLYKIYVSSIKHGNMRISISQNKVVYTLKYISTVVGVYLVVGNRFLKLSYISNNLWQTHA
jgi:hypothetical protein